MNQVNNEEVKMKYFPFTPSDETLRALSALKSALIVPTGNSKMDTENAAIIETHDAAIRDGRHIFASVPNNKIGDTLQVAHTSGFIQNLAE